VDGRGTGSLRAGADGVLVPVEKDLSVRVLALEFGDLGEDVLEGGRLVIGIDPNVNGLFRPVVRTRRCDHDVPREQDAWGGL
jgi:hypothetical protein